MESGFTLERISLACGFTGTEAGGTGVGAGVGAGIGSETDSFTGEGTGDGSDAVIGSGAGSGGGSTGGGGGVGCPADGSGPTGDVPVPAASLIAFCAASKISSGTAYNRYSCDGELLYRKNTKSTPVMRVTSMY